MKPTELLREILYPLTDMTIMLAMLVFLLLGSLAGAAGLLGLWLAAILLPAFFRYALYLLEARALGQAAPPPGIELFNWFENFWSLFPLILLVACGWFLSFIANNISNSAALFAGAVMMILFPAPIGILALSRSPVESLNPLALKRLIAACGPQYLWVPAVTAAGFAGVMYLKSIGTPGLLVNAAGIYVYFLLFTLTGALLHAKKVSVRVTIPEPLEPLEEVLEQRLLGERQRVANHAYGFVSRGNRAGGFRHIQQWIDAEEVDIDAARDWFFREMLTWEETDAALFFAQTYLSRLLGRQQDVAAIKLISRCLLENSRFRPLAGDRDAAVALLRRYSRDDLLRQLQDD